jgi:hypothetical protein
MLLPMLLAGQSLSDVSVKRERNFTGSSLYGFMNGGADLYLEYGVKELVTRDVNYKDEDFTFDIYEMPSPADAYGIYSLHTFKCQRADTLDNFDCLSAYQLQMAVGNKYLSVVFPSGSAKAKKAASELIRLYINVDDEINVTIPEQLQVKAPYSGVVKYLRGSLSVSNALSSLSKVFEEVNYSGIWLAGAKNTPDKRILIEFIDNESINKIKERIDKQDIIGTGEKFILIKYTEKETGEEDFGSFGF